ncbi:envelope integrity protein Cei [Actinomycetospora sp. TBRC 11914]|uniref:envelope integrity protein Cei n=1 Tax=Actinomycetospora sp. TBRC 11914 TaxID=2729387 RepID=UPI00145E59AA|nr:envelope integrity protein Cei [Actinomycetospora sp. TBRC 11914]NMO89791.1 envelope integrity protein Cei [Actinomycetospora sp. TBRC 11914]
MAASLPRAGGGYRRRHLLPMGLLVLVLAVASILTWIVVFANSTATSVTSCNAAATGGGTVQSRTALDSTAAAPPADTAVRVLNGAGQRGSAQLAAVELGELGIPEAGQPDNDPLYPAQDLSCVGQIRYGPDGASAARTLSLVVPCAELVEDNRQGAAVDLALGSDFRDITPSQGVTQALKALGQGSTSGTDPSSLSGLRDVDCSA